MTIAATPGRRSTRNPDDVFTMIALANGIGRDSVVEMYEWLQRLSLRERAEVAGALEGRRRRQPKR